MFFTTSKLERLESRYNAIKAELKAEYRKPVAETSFDRLLILGRQTEMAFERYMTEYDKYHGLNY